MSSRLATEVERQFKPGYRLRRIGNGHYEVLDPEGKRVRHLTGMPLHVPYSPAGRGKLKLLRIQLQQAGVIA